MEKYIFNLGRAAHDAGRLRSPAMDALMMQELEGMPVGTGAAEMIQEWTDGWDAAHKTYEERMAAMRYEPYTEGTRP